MNKEIYLILFHTSSISESKFKLFKISYVIDGRFRNLPGLLTYTTDFLRVSAESQLALSMRLKPDSERRFGVEDAGLNLVPTCSDLNT